MGLPVQIVTSTGELIENTKIYFISQQVDNAIAGNSSEGAGARFAR